MTSRSAPPDPWHADEPDAEGPLPLPAALRAAMSQSSGVVLVAGPPDVGFEALVGRMLAARPASRAGGWLRHAPDEEERRFASGAAYAWLADQDGAASARAALRIADQGALAVVAVRAADLMAAFRRLFDASAAEAPALRAAFARRWRAAVWVAPVAGPHVALDLVPADDATREALADGDWAYLANIAPSDDAAGGAPGRDAQLLDLVQSQRVSADDVLALARDPAALRRRLEPHPHAHARPPEAAEAAGAAEAEAAAGPAAAGAVPYDVPVPPHGLTPSGASGDLERTMSMRPPSVVPPSAREVPRAGPGGTEGLAVPGLPVAAPSSPPAAPVPPVPPVPTSGPPAPTDRLQLRTYAPAACAPGRLHAVDVWACLASQARDVDELAAAVEPRPLAGLRSGVVVARGTVLGVRLSVGSLRVEPEVQPMPWHGEPVNASFLVDVPAGTADGDLPALVQVTADGLPLGTIAFVWRIRAAAPAEPLPPVPQGTMRAHRSAFASYASEDREAVLERVAGVKAWARDLEIFIDVQDLRAGESWQQRIEEELARRERLLLFWSARAQRSRWVDFEWRTAVRLKGVQVIDPVPLEDPRDAPPPPELAHLHFNESLLPLIAAERARAGAALR